MLILVFHRLLPRMCKQARNYVIGLGLYVCIIYWYVLYYTGMCVLYTGMYYILVCVYYILVCVYNNLVN